MTDADLSQTPIYDRCAWDHGFAPMPRPLGAVRTSELVRVPGLIVSPGSTMTRPDVPHRSIPDSWRN